MNTTIFRNGERCIVRLSDEQVAAIYAEGGCMAPAVGGGWHIHRLIRGEINPAWAYLFAAEEEARRAQIKAERIETR